LIEAKAGNIGFLSFLLDFKYSLSSGISLKSSTNLKKNQKKSKISIAKMVDTKVTLGYWGGFRGLGEIERLVLEYCGVKYDEKFYTFDKKEEWFAGDKQTLGFDFPNLPYLISGDCKVTESEAIIIYVAHKTGKTHILGKDAKDQVKVATFRGVCKDIF